MLIKKGANPHPDLFARIPFLLARITLAIKYCDNIYYLLLCSLIFEISKYRSGGSTRDLARPATWLDPRTGTVDIRRFEFLPVLAKLWSLQTTDRWAIIVTHGWWVGRRGSTTGQFLLPADLRSRRLWYLPKLSGVDEAIGPGTPGQVGISKTFRA